MKTRDIITILRCHAATAESCRHCPSRVACQKFDPCSEEWEDLIAERFEQLIVCLTKTNEQLAKLKAENAYLRAHYEGIMRDLREVIYDHNIVERGE